MDLYSTLQVKPSASQTEIKRAYRRLALQHHPDKPGGDASVFQQLSLAYEVLGRSDSRAQYDLTGSVTESSTTTDWRAFFAALFPGLSKDRISEFEREYKGSQAEIDDVCLAYVASNGALVFIYCLF